MAAIIMTILIAGIATIIVGRKENDHEKMEFGFKILLIVAILSAFLTFTTLIFKIIVWEVQIV
jgi:hypothetical protein